jgi:phage baseplate assembly protein V
MSSYVRERDFDRRFYGVVEALVVDNVDPDKEGRIKVTFPWYDDGTITEWVRVRQLYAGPGYGTFFVPELGDEVLVAFIHGDMRKAIILGGLYNGRDKPPSDRQSDSTKDEKMIRTKGGHLLLFDDTSDKKKIQLLTDGGHSLSLDDAGAKITVSTSGGQTIVMDATTGAITLTGITLTVVGEVSIGLESPTINLAGATVTLAAPSVVIGDAPTDRMVMGDKLMTLFNNHTHPAPGGSTSAPTQQMGDSELSQTAKVG